MLNCLAYLHSLFPYMHLKMLSLSLNEGICFVTFFSVMWLAYVMKSLGLNLAPIFMLIPWDYFEPKVGQHTRLAIPSWTMYMWVGFASMWLWKLQKLATIIDAKMVASIFYACKKCNFSNCISIYWIIYNLSWTMKDEKD